MNRNERLVLAAWFVAVLLVLLTQVSAAFTVLGAVAGAVAGVPAARTGLLLRRARSRLPGGDVALPGGVRLERVGRSIGAHLGAVLLLVLVAAAVPGLRDRFVALCAGAVTAFCLTVTAQRLRRG